VGWVKYEVLLFAVYLKTTHITVAKNPEDGHVGLNM
jgi:hypothetical protein